MSGATSFTSVPIVDISGLRSPDRAERERVARRDRQGRRRSRVLLHQRRGRRRRVVRAHVGGDQGVLRAAARGEDALATSGCPNATAATCPRARKALATGKPELKEAFDTALDLPADDPDYLAGNPMLGPEHVAGPAGVRRCGDRLLRRGARGRAPVAVGVRGGAGRGSRHVLQARHQDAEPAAAHPLPVQPRCRGRPRHRRAHRLRVLHPAQADRAGPRGAQRRGRVDRRAARARHLRRQHRRHAGAVDQRRVRGDQPPGPQGAARSATRSRCSSTSTTTPR